MGTPNEKEAFALKLLERVKLLEADIDEASAQIEEAKTNLDKVLDDLGDAAYPLS